MLGECPRCYENTETVVLENLVALHGLIIVKFSLDETEFTVKQSRGVAVHLPHKAISKYHSA